MAIEQPIQCRLEGIVVNRPGDFNMTTDMIRATTGIQSFIQPNILMSNQSSKRHDKIVTR